MTNAAIEVPEVEAVDVTPDHHVTWEITETQEATVSVTFTCATTEITHERSVNTFDLDDDGIQVRLGEVARGVHNKICVGAITAPSEEPEVEADAA
jgi:hypothetical protein